MRKKRKKRKQEKERENREKQASQAQESEGYILGGCWLELRFGNGLPVLLTKQAAGGTRSGHGPSVGSSPHGYYL